LFFNLEADKAFLHHPLNMLQMKVCLIYLCLSSAYL